MSYDFEFSNAADRLVSDSHADFTSQVSVSLWLKSESNPGTNQTNYFLKTKSGANSDHNFGITWTPSGSGDIYIMWHNPSTTMNEWKADYNPTVGAWTHFYFSIDWTTNPDTVSLWINGASQTVTHNFGSNNIAPVTAATQVYYIGGPGSGDPNFTDGKLAEIAVWSDLDTTRIAPLAAGASPILFPTNRVEYWMLREGLANENGGVATISGGTPVFSTDHPSIYYHEDTPHNAYRNIKVGNGMSRSEGAT